MDTATYGVPPRFVTDGLHECLNRWGAGQLELSAFGESIVASRAAYAALVGADEHRVAMSNSVSSAIGLVAASIPAESRIATLSGEYTSVTFPFAAQAARGVTVTELPPGWLEDAAGDFDVVAASLVQSADGAVLDVETLRRSIADTGTVSVIDLSQALGWKNVDLSWADVAVTAGYKWLLAPRGVAWMSLSERISETLVPVVANPFAAPDLWSALYGLPLRLASDARRFDCSPAWFSVFGAGLSLPWLASLDRAAVEAHVLGLANRLRAELRLPPADSAIVSIPQADDADAVQKAADALQKAGIRASVRAGAVRVGFHLYNTEEDLGRLLEALDR